MLRQIIWCFERGNATSPRLFRLLCLNALMSTLFPAGVALAGRGLINSTSVSLNSRGTPDMAGIYVWLAVGAAMTLGMVCTGSIARYLGQRLSLDVNHQLQMDLLVQTQNMGFEDLEDPGFHNALRRAQAAAETQVANVVLTSLDMVGDTIKAGSLMGILLVIEPILFLLLLPVGIPYLIHQSRLLKRQFVELDARVEKQRWIGSYTHLLGSDQEAAEVRMLGVAPLLIQRCGTLREEFRQIQRNYLHIDFVGNITFAVLSVLAIYTAMGRAAFTIVQGQLTIGDLAIYGSAATQLRGLVETSISQLARIRLQLLHVGNVRNFLSQGPPPARQRVTESHPHAGNGAIEFRDVTFLYRGSSRPVLEGLSLTIAPGETVALVGRNGAGKTTIAKLIAGLYQPTGGTILFDGVDSRDFSEEERRRHVGCLFQHFGRYPGTAADNISFGDWQTLLDQSPEIERIARSAGVHHLITSMPQGYATVLGRSFGHYQPSGGQWQQLAIARTMARPTPILILDEPTASLDIDSEVQVFLRFRQLARGRTVLLISHRFSTVRMADRILVLEKGRLVESGNHDVLMQAGGAYASLVELHERHRVDT